MSWNRWICAVLLTAACHTPPPPRVEFAPRPVVELERFAVTRGSERVGRLVQREIQDPAGPVRYWLVENAAGQWLGYIDAVGRVYRYEPFAERERFVGMYPMEQGLRLLYGGDQALRISSEVSAAREASAPR